MNPSGNRNSNIELLRILAMMGVVMLHYNNPDLGGGMLAVPSGSLSEVLMFFLESVFIGAINVFIIISGYYLSDNKKLGFFKPITLYIQVFFFKILLYLIDLITSFQQFSIKGMLSSLAPKYWFFSVYIALYMISPFINVLLEKLESKALRTLMILLIVLFSIQPTIVDALAEYFDFSLNQMNFIGGAGTNHGYNIVQFVLMYVIGVVIRKHESEFFRVPATTYILIFILCTGITTVWSYFQETALNYSNPVVIAASVSLFMVFLKIKPRTNKVINTIAKASFTVYLLNVGLLRFFNIPLFVTKGAGIYLLHTFAVALSIYLFSLALYFIFDLITKPLFRSIHKHTEKWDYTIK
ncbi:MAG: acyltransferase family protein [Saccharofermentans sp.]|nr:acyltransferase family protein [Saccharofermentans sp.]